MAYLSILSRVEKILPDFTKSASLSALYCFKKASASKFVDAYRNAREVYNDLQRLKLDPDIGSQFSHEVSRHMLNLHNILHVSDHKLLARGRLGKDLQVGREVIPDKLVNKQVLSNIHSTIDYDLPKAKDYYFKVKDYLDTMKLQRLKKQA